MQRGFLNHFLHLHHHNTAVIVHRLGNNQCVDALTSSSKVA